MLLHLTVLTQVPFTALRVCNDSVYIHVSVLGILSKNILGGNVTKSRQNKINVLD